MKLVIILLVIFVASAALILLKPELAKGFWGLILNSFSLLLNIALQRYEKLRIYCAAWISRFKPASRKDKWLMIRKPVYLILALFLVLKFGPLFLPPKISTSFPGNKSNEASLNSTIEIIFDKPVIRTLAEKSLILSPNIQGNITWEGDQKLIFTPKENLTRASVYKVDFKSIVLSKYFIPLIGNKSLTFETIGNPKVVLNSPGREALEDLTPITVVFNRPMIPLTTATNVEEKLPAFTIEPQIEGEGRWLGTTAYQFRPSEPFIKATTFKVTVPAGLKSEDGGVLQEDFSWEFSSERPKVVEISPTNGELYADPNGPITVTFNQDIDPKSASEKFGLVLSGGPDIKGRITVSKNILKFTPLIPLSRDVLYEPRISPGIQSTQGPNGLEEAYSSGFTTATAPVVLYTTPSDASKDIEEQSSIDVTFATPMDEDSFEGNVFISPKPEVDPSFYFSTYNNQNRLSIGTYLGRSQNYTVTIGANVKDQYGVALGKPFTFSFATSAYKPSISIYPSGTYFAAFNQDVIPRIVTQVINSERIDYTLYKLTRENLLELYRKRYIDSCYYTDDSCKWQNYDTQKLQVVRAWTENYSADFNTPIQVVTKVQTDSGDKIPSGFYFLDAKIPQGPHDNMVMIVSKSTITVKKSENQIFTWAVNQSTSGVVSDMKMQLTDAYNSVLSEGTSNNDGVFMKEVDLFEKRDLFVFGEKDDDVVVAAGAWSTGINRYDFGLPSYYTGDYKSYNTKENYKTFITLDRPIYRPGQKIYFKGVVKKDNDGAYENVKPGEQIIIGISDAQNRTVYTQSLSINSFGSFFGDYTLSNDAALGYYSAKSTFNGNTTDIQFQVEEYQKPDVAVNVTLSKKAYTQNETAQVTANASYYFGAPVSNAPLNWTLLTQDYDFRWDKDWRFEFGDPESNWSSPWWYYDMYGDYDNSEKITEGKGQTDTKGDFELSLPLDISKYKTSQNMRIEVTVNDINNESIASSQQFVVNRAGVYAGLRPVSYSNKSGEETKVEVVAVDINGKEVTDKSVSVQFYKRTWETVKEKNPDGGVFYYVSKPTDTLVDETNVETDSLGKAMASFTPKEGGTYKVVAKVSDNNGNLNTSGSFLWVSGYGFSVARENNDRIVLVTDKRDYFVGEDMSVFVATPFGADSAKTLLTAERGSVLDYKIVETGEESNNFKLSVDPKYTPNAFIGAVLVRGGNQVKKPAEFKVGYTEVKVTDKKQQLDVRISTDKQKYKPKETLKATVETKDLLGHPVSAELAVGLIDKAVWDLARAELPDIYKTFYQPRNLEVSTAQLLSISMDRINANTNLGSKGGSGGGCFAGDTPILMQGGVYKNIQDVVIGDTILTRQSDSSDRLVEAKVTKTYKHNVDEYLILNGELRVTPIHRLFVNGNWITAAEIEIGDYLLDKNNKEVKVFSIEQIYGDFEVYNLEIEKYRTYFAGDIYVHNQKGGGFETARTDFPDTAYWNPTLKTDNNGKAQIEIQLPDSLTTWRLAAIANTQESAFGSKVSEVTVSRDVLIRPFLPRFLMVGDESKLGAIIVNTSGENQNLIATIESDGLQISENKTKQITLGDGEQAKLTWDTVASNVDSTKIRLAVESTDKSLGDVVEVSLPIKSYSVPEVVATSGQAKDTANEKILLPNEVDLTQGSATISISPSLGGNSINALPYLFDYQYYCTEQITSRLLPSVFVHRVLKNAKLDTTGSVSIGQLESVINDGIQRLNNQQHAEGGWGWWNEFSSDPYMSAYAYQGLVEAKKSGFTVADSTLTRARNYLMTRLNDKSNIGATIDIKAYILYVLKDEGTKINLQAYASNLYEHRFELSLQSRAYLAMVMRDTPSVLGAGGRARTIYDELLSLAKKTATSTHWEEQSRYDYFGSNLTTTANMLEAITVFDKNSPLIPEIVRYLMASRTGEYWSNTRTTAAVVKAISTQLLNKEDQKVNENYKLELNGKVFQEGKFTKEDLLKVQDFVVSISGLNIGSDNDLKITKSGEGNLYYNINLKYYLPFSEIKPLDQGFVVIREFVDDAGNILPSNMIAENSEVWARLIIVAPEERRYVTIEDILPAGLESVNESLKNVSVLNKQRPILSNEDNRILYFDHKEYHDDRTSLFASYLPAGVYEFSYRVRATTPGRYHRPPAQAYEMYFPDVSGHSDGGWLEVK